MSAASSTPQVTTSRSPLPPLTPASPATEQRLIAHDNPKCIAISDYLFYCVLYNLIRVADAERGVEAHLYSIIAHILNAFCFAVLAAFSYTPQPKIFVGSEWRSPDFGVYRHFMDGIVLAFAWEAKPLETLGLEDWLGAAAKNEAGTMIQNHFPQVCQQALFFFRSHPDVDVFHVMCSMGLFCTSLIFRRPKFDDDDDDSSSSSDDDDEGNKYEPETPQTPIPRPTKKQRQEYGELLKNLQDQLAMALEEQLRPEVLYFNEPLMDEHWHISPKLTSALYMAASASFGGGLEVQNSWMKPTRDDPNAVASKESLELGRRALRDARDHMLLKIKEPLYELLGQHTWVDSAKTIKKSPSPYVHRKVVAGLGRRILPDRAARPLNFNPPSDEFSSSPLQGTSAHSPPAGQPEPLPAAFPKSPSERPTIAQRLSAPFSPPDPPSSPIMDRQARARMQQRVSNASEAGPSNVSLGKRPRRG